MNSREFNKLTSPERIAYLTSHAELIDERMVSKTSYAVLYDATDFFAEVFYEMDQPEKDLAKVITVSELLTYYMKKMMDK